MNGSPEIVRRTIQHGRLAYQFQWNVTTHRRLGKDEGDLASLWALLSMILSSKIPETPFNSPFYARASSLKLTKMSPMKLVSLRKKFFKTGRIKSDPQNPLVKFIRDFHKNRNDTSYSANHGILQDFLYHDPDAIAIEVPVWSDRFHLTGHIDLIRYSDNRIQVCDYKPGPLSSLPKRFMESLPQVSAYGEMMVHHIAGSFHSGYEKDLLPTIQCCIFDTHSCWIFGAEMFVVLQASGLIDLL